MYRIKRFFRFVKYIISKKYSVQVEPRTRGVMVLVYKGKHLYDKLYFNIQLDSFEYIVTKILIWS